MSVKIMTAVFYAKLTPLKADNSGKVVKVRPATQKIILLAMADHANDEGKGIYPDQELLRLKTGLSNGTLNLGLKALLAAGLIFKAGRKASGPVDYDINVAKIDEFYAKPDPRPVSNSWKQRFQQLETEIPTVGDESSLTTNESEEDEGDPQDKQFRQAIRAWENVRGTINAIEAQLIGEICDDWQLFADKLPKGHPDLFRPAGEVVQKAIEITATQADRPNLKYVEAVIKSWKQHGFGNSPNRKRPGNGKGQPPSTDYEKEAAERKARAIAAKAGAK
jgi:DnaD/phage-associated family protein